MPPSVGGPVERFGSVFPNRAGAYCWWLRCVKKTSREQWASPQEPVLASFFQLHHRSNSPGWLRCVKTPFEQWEATDQIGLASFFQGYLRNRDGVVFDDIPRLFFARLDNGTIPGRASFVTFPSWASIGL